MVLEGAQVQHAGEDLEPVLVSQGREVLQSEGEQVEGWSCYGEREDLYTYQFHIERGALEYIPWQLHNS